MGLRSLKKKQKPIKDESSGKSVGHRYSAKVQKDESVWKQEWSGFMSGVSLKTVKDGANKIVLQSSKDLSYETEKKGEEGGTEEYNFSYLFNSPAEKKAARLLTKKKFSEKASTISRHQEAILEAEKMGLQLAGMTRKEKRKFLQLSVPVKKVEEEEDKNNGAEKPHEFMDPKLAWYQQGPFPIDVIAEKLVRKKAEKKGKQFALKYNYLLPHPSWMAKRAIRRRESVAVPMGKRAIFDDEGQEIDPLASLYSKASTAGVSVPCPLGSEDASLEGRKNIILDDLLMDPVKAATSTVRKVVKNKQAAAFIHRANLSTNFLSKSLIRGKAEDSLF